MIKCLFKVICLIHSIFSKVLATIVSRQCVLKCITNFVVWHEITMKSYVISGDDGLGKLKP